jgi:putative transposase
MSIARQCDVMGLSRSTYYYQRQGESAENLTLMRLLDKQYTDTP